MPPPKPATLLFLLLLFSAAPFTAPAIDYHRVNLRDISFKPSHDHYHRHIHNISNPSRNRTANKHELSLTLLHHDAVSGRSYASHRDRVADLLSRDSARAESITRRLSPEYYRVDDFESEVVSGLDEGSGEYFVRVGVGSPPKDQYLVVDSGSDVIWV